MNFVAFNTAVTPWRDRLTKINESTAQSQLQPWIDGLHAEGTTNTLAALRFAMADSATEAIYLLTDGRPDQVDLFFLLISKFFFKRNLFCRANDIFCLKFNIVKLYQFTRLLLIVTIKRQINFFTISPNKLEVVFTRLTTDLKNRRLSKFLKSNFLLISN